MYPQTSGLLEKRNPIRFLAMEQNASPLSDGSPNPFVVRRLGVKHSQHRYAAFWGATGAGRPCNS